jgi:hypothetical protein
MLGYIRVLPLYDYCIYGVTLSNEIIANSNFVFFSHCFPSVKSQLTDPIIYVLGGLAYVLGY